MTDNKELSKALDQLFWNLGLRFGTKFPEPETSKLRSDPEKEEKKEPVNIDDFNAEDIAKIVQDKILLDEKELVDELNATAKAIFNDIMQIIITKNFRTLDNGDLTISINGPLKRQAYTPTYKLQPLVNALLNEKGLELKYMLIVPVSTTMLEDYQLSLMDKFQASPLNDQ
jgi:hypothetical protein